jgi:hypothetical protein
MRCEEKLLGNWFADNSTAPSLNLTPEEKRVFGQLFRQADSESLGVVTGEVAVKFFEKTRLDPRVLGEVCETLRPNPSTIEVVCDEPRLTQLLSTDMADCGHRE